MKKIPHLNSARLFGWNEFKIALLLALSATLLTLLVPNRTIDPWGVFNPKQFGFIVITLATLQFAGFVIAKRLGEKRAHLLVGFFGGLVSSTAVLMAAAKRAQENSSHWRSPLTSVLAAQLAALIEVAFILGLTTPELLRSLAPVIGLMLITSLLILIRLTRKLATQKSEFVERPPVNWKSVLRLSFFLAAVLAVIALAKLLLGDNAAQTVSFLTAFFELHGVTLANATLLSHGQLALSHARSNIFWAITASLLAKVIIAWTIERGSFAKGITAVFFGIWISGFLVVLFL